MVGPNAPQEVKDAWMDAAKEVNANGMGIRGNGMMSHISQMRFSRSASKKENFTGRFWREVEAVIGYIMAQKTGGLLNLK